MGIDISRFVSLKEREKAHLASKRAREVGIPLRNLLSEISGS